MASKCKPNMGKIGLIWFNTMGGGINNFILSNLSNLTLYYITDTQACDRRGRVPFVLPCKEQTYLSTRLIFPLF